MKLAASLLALGVIATLTTAQTAPCAALNDATNSVSNATTLYGFAGPNRFGWKYTPASNMTIQAARIFTDNTFLPNNFMTLELWSDAGTGFPAARLAGGTWKLATGRGNAWVGCDFDSAVAVLGGNSYWLVWTEPGFSIPCTQPGGVTLPSVSGGPTTFSTSAPQAPKFRLYCSALDSQNVVVKGAGCAANSGAAGSTFVNWNPTVGNLNFTIEGSGFPAGAPAILVLGFTPTFPSVPITGAGPGCNLESDIYFYFEPVTGTGNVRSTAAFGHTLVPLGLPNDPTLIGLIVTAQLAAVEIGSPYPLPIVTGNGLVLTIY